MEDDALTRALYENYARAGRETGYWGNYFLRDLRKYGGLAVAKRMLAKKNKGGQTKGFLALADAGRPDLSVEAVVLSPQFKSLFTHQELATATERLQRFSSPTTRARVDPSALFPNELQEGADYRDGAVKRVLVNRYERDQGARAACLVKHGFACKICGLRFEKRYGEIGKGFIHVHHIKPLGLRRRDYKVDPQKDLIPVCPNCHAMLHSSEPPLSPDELKARLT